VIVQYIVKKDDGEDTSPTSTEHKTEGEKTPAPQQKSAAQE
jgi:hypothetical protein